MLSNIASALGMVLTGLFFFIVPAMRLKPGWLPLILGALLWVVAVVLKFAWAIPMNATVLVALQTALGREPGNTVFLVYVGLLTGVFECGLIYLAVRVLPFLRKLDVKGALAVGYGFGAIEALLIGLGALVPTLMSIYAPGSLSPEIAAHIHPLDWALMPAGTVERIGTIFVHAYTTWLIFYAVRTRRIGWFWWAFLFKSAIDTVAAWGQLSYGLGSATHIWTLEAIVIAFAAVSVWGIMTMRRRWAEIETVDP